MPLHLNELSKTDSSDLYLLPTLGDIHLRAWLTNKLYKTIYYGPPSSYPAIVDANMARHRNGLLDDPNARFVVVLHSDMPEVGEPWKVISFVKFNIFRNAAEVEARKDATERAWPPYTNLALVNEFWAEIVKFRQKSGRDLGPHVLIDILATDPEYQRQGAGGLLMEYVIAEVDRLGLPCMLEGSPQGLKLYESVGLKVVSTIWTDIERFKDGGDKGEEWRGGGKPEQGGEGWYPQFLMIRPAKKV